MSDSLLRTDPVPAEVWLANGVTIRLAAPRVRYLLRARAAAAIAELTACDAPERVGRFVGDLACLGPDEWLWRPVAARVLAPGAAPVSVVDVSERSIGLIVEGPGAARVLESGCPLDLANFEVGRVTRTLFESVEIVLFHVAEHSWQVEVWRSFSPWLWQALTTAAGRG